MDFSSFIAIFLLIPNLLLINGEISRLRLCGDPNCKDPISEGITLIKYIRGENGILSFQKNTKVIIYGKSAEVEEANEELWEGEINGKRGFLPRRFIKETRILRKNLEYQVPVKVEDDSSQTEKDDDFKTDPTPYFGVVLSESRTTPTETTSETDTISNALSTDVPKEISSDRSLFFEVKPTLTATLTPVEVNASSIDNEVGSNSAVWFPEAKVSEGTRSGSVFPMFGVSADSSVGEKERTSSEKLGKDSLVLSEVDGTVGTDKYELIDGSTIFIDDLATDSLMLSPSETNQSPEIHASTPTLVQSSSDAPTLMTTSSVIASSKPVEAIKTDGGLLGDIFEFVKGGVKDFIKNSQMKRKLQVKSNRKANEVESDAEATNFESDVTSETEATTSETNIESKDSSDENLESNVPLDAAIESKQDSEEKMDQKSSSEERIESSDDTVESVDANIESKDSFDEKLVSNVPLDAEVESKQVSDEKFELKSSSEEQIKSDDNSGEKLKSSEPLDSRDSSELKAEPIETAVMESNVKSEPNEELKVLPNSITDTASDEDDEDLDDDAEDDAEDLDDDLDEEDEEDGEITSKNIEPSLEDGITESPEEKSYFKETATDRPIETSSSDENEVTEKDLEKIVAVGSSEVRNAETADTSVIPLNDVAMDSNENQTEVEDLLSNDTLTLKSVDEESESYSLKNNRSTLESLDAFNETVDTEIRTENSSVEIDVAINVTEEVEIANEYEKELQEKVLTSTVSMFHHDLVDSIEESTTEGSSLPLAELGSCDAASGFDGSCPKLAEQKDEVDPKTFADIEVPSVEDDVDYVQLALVYLWFLRDAMQFVVDCLPEPIHTVLVDLESAAVSPRVVVFTTIVGFFILLLQISIVIIKKRRKEKELVKKLCNLDKLHFVVTKVKDELKEKLDNFNHNITSWKSDYAGAQDAVTSLQLELDSSKSECETLRVQVTSLEEQLEMSTDAGLELNSMLSQFLTSQRDGGKLQEAVERLQGQLESQRGQLADLQRSSENTDLENRKLRTELDTCVEKNEQLATRLEQTMTELKDLEAANEEFKSGIAERDECIEKLQITSDQLLKEAEVWDESVKELQGQLEHCESELKVATDSLDLKCRELESVKESVEKLRTVKRTSESDDAVRTDDVDDVWQSLLEVSSLKSDLQTVTRERDDFSSQLRQEIEARREADDLSKRAVDDSEVLRKEYECAHREREEAMKKLEILSTYFKEKEMQLQKELGVQETKRQQSHENATSVNMKMNLFEQEVELYKSQISSLKTEISSLERSYKNQIASHEKKAHENWLAARAAERKLEESKQEAATLRNKLTLLEQEKSSSHQSETSQKYVRSNGEAPSPPRLGPNDRYDSMDLPTSSRSSLFRESIDFPNGIGVPFLPVDRPLPPPFLRGLPPPPLLPPPLLHPPFDNRGPLPPPPFDNRGPLPPLPFDPRRAPPPESWMPLPPRRRPMSPSSYNRDRPSPTSSNASQRNQMVSPPSTYDRRQSSTHRNGSPPSDVDPCYGRPPPYDDRGNPRPYENPARMGWPGPPSGVRPLPSHIRRDVYPPGQSDGRIDPRTSSPMTRPQTDDRDTAGV